MQKLSYYFLHPQELVAALGLPRGPFNGDYYCYIRNKERGDGSTLSMKILYPE
jgi:hypothetical protein